MVGIRWNIMSESSASLVVSLLSVALLDFGERSLVSPASLIISACIFSSSSNGMTGRGLKRAFSAVRGVISKVLVVVGGVVCDAGVSCCADTGSPGSDLPFAGGFSVLLCDLSSVGEFGDLIDCECWVVPRGAAPAGNNPEWELAWCKLGERGLVSRYSIFSNSLLTCASSPVHVARTCSLSSLVSFP